MKVLRWLGACLTVYIRHLFMLSEASLVEAVMLIFVLLLAAALGPLATVVLILIAVFVLPALNSDVREEIDKEYTRSRK